MNIWFFVLLTLAIALIVGPVAMLRPKPAQRHKEALRKHAAGRGFRFGMRTLPKLNTAADEPRPSPVYYLSPDLKMQSMPTWILIKTDYQHEGNFYAEWDWHGENQPNEAIQALLKEAVPRLPNSVAAISQGKGGTCVFWNERGDIAMLDELIALIAEIHRAATEPT